MTEMSALQDYYVHFFKEFRCKDCGSDVAYLSRPRTLTEKYILPAIGLKVVRCGDCFRRSVRASSLPSRPRDLTKKAPHSQMPAPGGTGSRVA